jgi:hypothetical protein
MAKARISAFFDVDCVKTVARQHVDQAHAVAAFLPAAIGDRHALAIQVANVPRQIEPEHEENPDFCRRRVTDENTAVRIER